MFYTNHTPEPRHVTQLAFLRRFTIEEEVGLELAAADNPTAEPEARAFSATLRVALGRLRAAKFVDLDDAELHYLLSQLAAAGLLAAERVAAVLDAPVQAHERP